MPAITIHWRPEADEFFRRQVAWLETNRGQEAVTRFLEEVAHVLTRLGSGQITYRPVDAAPGVHCCPVNKHLQLYYRSLGESELELLAFFDSRQDPNKLRL